MRAGSKERPGLLRSPSDLGQHPRGLGSLACARITVDHLLQAEPRIDAVADDAERLGLAKQRRRRAVARAVVDGDLVELDDRAVVLPLAEVRLADPELRVVSVRRRPILVQIV